MPRNIGNPLLCSYLFIDGSLARKFKIILFISEDIVRKAKSMLVIEGKSLSSIVEEFLMMYDELSFLDKLCESLGFESRFYTDTEILADRPRGFRAEKVVQEIQDERSENLSGL